MTEVGEVDAELVEASGVGLEAEQRHLVGGGEAPEFGAGGGGFAALRIVGKDHALAQPDGVFGRDAQAAERGIDLAVLLLDATGDQGEVVFVDLAAHRQGAELGGGFRRACHQDRAAGFAVKAVDQGDELAGIFFLEPAEQRGFAVGARWMGEDVRRFGHDKEIGFLGEELGFEEKGHGAGLSKADDPVSVKRVSRNRSLFFIAWTMVLVLFCAGALRADPAYVQPGTGFVFPPEVASFKQVRITPFKADHSDVEVDYNNDPFTVHLSVYVYPANGPLKPHYEGCRDAVGKATPGAKLVEEKPIDLDKGGVTFHGFYGLLSFHTGIIGGTQADLLSQVIVFRRDNNYVLYRISYLASDRVAAEKAIAEFLEKFDWPAGGKDASGGL